MIWRRAKIVALSTTIVRHDEDQVELEDGRLLRKEQAHVCGAFATRHTLVCLKFNIYFILRSYGINVSTL